MSDSIAAPLDGKGRTWAHLAGSTGRPYHGDVTAALRSLQRQVFADASYYWPHNGQYEEWPVRPRPASVDELWADEFVQHSGSHSILDVDTVIGPGEPDDFGTVRPLPATDIAACFGTGRPTPADFDRAADNSRVLPELPNWSAYSMVLFEEDRPVEVAFWGFSGD